MVTNGFKLVVVVVMVPKTWLFRKSKNNILTALEPIMTKFALSVGQNATKSWIANLSEFSSFLLCIYENCQKCHKRVKCNYIFSNIVATQTTRILESEIEKNEKKRWHRKCYIYLKRKSHLFFTISGPHIRAHKKFYIFRSTFPNLLVPKLLFYSCCGDLVKFYDCDLAHLDDGVDCS